MRPRRFTPQTPRDQPTPIEVVHARRSSEERALCGAHPSIGGQTTRRRFVTRGVPAGDRDAAEDGAGEMTGSLDTKFAVFTVPPEQSGQGE